MQFPPIRARLLGPTDLRIGEAHIVWPRRDARTLFLLLLMTPDHRLPRDTVLETLWPETAATESGRNALYKALHALRRALEPALYPGGKSAYIESGHGTIGLDSSAELVLDIDRFESLVRMSETIPDPRTILRDALDLYRGPLLGDELAIDWAEGRRESLRDLHRRSALRLAELELEHGNSIASIGRLQAVLVDDPLQEDVHRAVIRALMDCGQPAAAREHLVLMRELFAHELGQSVTPETETLVTAAADGTITPLARHRPPVLGLPGLPTETIGREKEIAQVRDRLLRMRSRLTTIVGAGGVGKTRIAIEAARQSTTDFPDGIGFVDLTTIADSSLIHARIGQVLGVTERPGMPIAEVVANLLRRRPQFLLVLDNLEHLPEAGVVVADLLERSPALRVLVTSRIRLRIRAESLVRIEPFPLPTTDRTQALRTNPAIIFFLQCVRDSNGEIGDRAAIPLPVVAEICRRLDGLPLALELAAARYWELGPTILLEQLDDRFGLLRDGPLDLPDRHRTLDATLAWSCGLLSDEQLRLFEGLSIFANGAEPDALKAVLGDAIATSADVLIEGHLAHWNVHDGRRRLTQLETMRAYARSQLQERSDAAALRSAHARYYAELAFAGRARQPRGLEQLELARLLEREQANVHRALETALEMDQPDLALQICVGMGTHWFTQGPTEQALAWIGESLERASDRTTEAFAWSALWGAALAWQRGDIEQVARFEQRAARAWAALGSEAGLARLSHSRAQRLALEGALDDALSLHRANLVTFQRGGDLEGVVFSRVSAAYALEGMGRLDEALIELETALDEARAQDDLLLQSHILIRLPGVLLDQNALTRAESATADAERIHLLVGDRMALPWVSIVRCWIAWERGRYGDAYRAARLALGHLRTVADERNELCGLVACVAAAAAGSRAEALAHARELVQRLATVATDEELGLGLPPLADLIGRIGSIDDARVIFAGAMTACAQANVPRWGQRERYYASIRSLLGIDTPFQTVDPGKALDHAVAALEVLSPPDLEDFWKIASL